MSFFERMMKMNQINTNNPRESFYHEEETNTYPVPSSQVQLEKHQLSHSRYSELKSNRPFRMQELEDDSDNGWQQIQQQPQANIPYKGSKPQLLHHLLPKKQQMLRQMMERKRQFELRKMNLCNQNKGNMLQSKVNEEFQKFKNNSLNSSVKIKSTSKNSQSKMKPSSVKDLSVNKPKPVLNLGESIYSVSMNTQMASSPVVNQTNFNQQIMLKLLNILQKEKTNTSTHQVQVQTPPLQIEDKKDKKQAPIIINNYMKTPMQGINRDLIERQIKLKVLQNNRYQRQVRKESSQKKIVIPQPETKISESFSIKDIAISQRTNSRPSLDNQQTVTKVYIQSSSKMQKKEEQQVKKQSVKSSRVSIQNKQDNTKMDEDSTKFNSNMDSRVTQERSHQSIKYRSRQFNQQKKKKGNAFQIESSSDNTTIATVKAPVKIQIPVQDSNGMEGMTLAQAFKKRVGRLKSQQTKTQNIRQKSPNLKNTSNLQSFPSHMAITITDKFTEYSSEFDYSVPMTSKNTTINLIEPITQRSAATRNKQKQVSLKKRSKQESSAGKNMSQPSKQLMDRLIYGEKAKVSKQQMYALTKKNYENLPEVQAKKREEEKRKIEQERKNKAKQYQKAIRSRKPIRN